MDTMKIKIILWRQLGEKGGVNVGNGITNTKGKEDTNVASEKEEDDAMEGNEEFEGSENFTRG